MSMTESYLRKRSQEILTRRANDSQIIGKSKQQSLPALRPTEIKTGRTLGKGSFCIVSALEGLNKHNTPRNHNHHHISKYQRGDGEEKTDSSQSTMSTSTSYSSICHDLGTRNGKKLYAIKKLKPGLYHKRSNVQFAQGIIDLAMEAKYLSALQHPHIISIRAIADIDDYSSEDFFIVIERLVMTLENQIVNWRNSLTGIQVFRGRINKSVVFCEKLMVGHDICSALDYLHSKKIVYRDLKPKNIGFDEKGDVKLFDFGTAAEMTERRRLKDTNTFKLSKKTGTYTYMSPEVFLGQPYNEKCDVYSFALLLWHCLEEKKPFDHYDDEMMASKVYSGNEIPPLNSDWTESLKSLFVHCLRRDFNNRYSCSELMTYLNTETGKVI